MRIDFWRQAFVFVVLCGFSACHLEMPVTSTITVDAEGLHIPVNPDLYGVTIEEINHGIDGGLYGELIQNRSFEDGIPPFNCPYDARRNLLTTPNGWSIPFLRMDSIPGWKPLQSNTQLYLDTKELINDKNRRSLLVGAYASPYTGRAGVVAEGYKGISIEKGKKYNFSFYTKGMNIIPKTIHVALEDSLTERYLSDVFSVEPLFDWRRVEHTFTATEDAKNAVLTITADSSVVFWVDVVSLFPQETWKGRKNGLRADLATLVDSLQPRFVRFPGGSFVEGYTAGTYPVWRETVGNIAERKHFWNIWAYGSTNGMGYHEYLELCEDLHAEPIYVINSGLTNQSRRPRYEDITQMDKLVNEALDAIAYANAPVDSAMGKWRVQNGHPEPFHLKYIQIGNENYGHEYSKRFALFQKAIKERYPDMIVISSSPTKNRNRADWVDTHGYAGGDFYFSSIDRFKRDRLSRRSQVAFIGEFGTTKYPMAGTLRAAIAEACFYIGAEGNPDRVRRLAYAPIFGNVSFGQQRYPLISFNTSQAVVSPSYHLLKMFNHHRGDEILNTAIDTYDKPQIYPGRVSIELFDNSFEFKDVKINNTLVSEIDVKRGGWNVEDAGHLVPEKNRWNHVVFGDSSLYNYDFTAMIRRTKGSGQIQLRVRDNGMSDEQADHITMTFGAGPIEFYRQVGSVKDELGQSADFSFESGRWYKVRIQCDYEYVRCYVDDMMVHEKKMAPIPSLVALATLDTAQHMIYLKVVNTTWHEEHTALRFEGTSIAPEIEAIQLSGEADVRNTFEQPDRVRPMTVHTSFEGQSPIIYNFPANSVTILKLRLD